MKTMFLDESGDHSLTTSAPPGLTAVGREQSLPG